MTMDVLPSDHSSETTMHNQQGLPITTSTTPPKIVKKLTLIPLIFLIYFEVAGGPYGEEPAVKAAGPLLAILGFLVFPFIWSIPEALITAELSTAFPGNGGFVIWADRAFGPFLGSLMGTLKYLSVVINIAAFPALGISYMQKLFPVFSSGRPRNLTMCLSTLVLSFINFTGLNIVGYVAVFLGIISLLPFIIMSVIAIPKISPKNWISLGQKTVKKDWNLYFNTLFWNLNFWDNVSTMAGEVEKPQKTFPKALLCAVILTCAAYIVPLMAVTGVGNVDQNEWDSGYMADAARMISGLWLKYWIEIGAVLSNIGLYQAQLSSSSYQLSGMAELGFLPKFFAKRSKWFNTPYVGILLSTAIILSVSFLEFSNIIGAANLLYGLGMLLEIASFLRLRSIYPQLTRPFRVPMRLLGLTIMCLIPSGFLVFIMAIATKVVYLISGSIIVGATGWYFLIKCCKSRKWFEFYDVDE